MTVRQAITAWVLVGVWLAAGIAATSAYGVAALPVWVFATGLVAFVLFGRQR